MTTSSLTRACVTAGTTGLLVLAAAGTASAHVTAASPEATQGGEAAVVTFGVPNESVTKTTTGVTVTLPADGTLLSVRAAPLAGWTAAVAKSANGTPTSVTWTAGAGTSIGADQFGQFAMDVGPLPETSTVTFDVTQTYNDGSAFQWNQAPNADGSEAEHPAPELTLAATTGGTAHAGTAVTASAVAEPTSSSDTTARWLGGGGLLLGALGLGLGVGATVRSRKRPAA